MFQPDDVEYFVKNSLKPNAKAKGVAIIVANEKSRIFNKPEDTLCGVIEDFHTTCSVFEELQYSVVKLLNASRKTIIEVIKAVAVHFPAAMVYDDNDLRYKRIVFCFSGHGDKNDHIHTADGEIDINSEIVWPLLPTKCKRLLHIPKLFFIDACRGKVIDRPVSRGGGGDEIVYSRVSTLSNYLLVRSTTPAAKAFEIPGRSGGFWTQCFVAELRKPSNIGRDIGYVLIEVNRHVNAMFNQSKYDCTQQAVAENTLLEHVFFLDEADLRKSFNSCWHFSLYSVIIIL